MANKTFEESDIEFMVREKVCKNCPYQNACDLKYGCLTGAFNQEYSEVQNGKR